MTMLDTIQTPSTRDALAVLAAYRRLFTRSNFTFGEEIASDGGNRFAYGPEATRFVTEAHEFGVVQDSFDWVSWLETEEAQKLMDNQEALAEADPDDLFHLVTACLRQDRILPGTLNQWIEEGLLARVAERAVVLLA